MEEKKENEIIEETDKITDEQEAPAAQDAPEKKDTTEEKKGISKVKVKIRSGTRNSSTEVFRCYSR